MATKNANVQSSETSGVDAREVEVAPKVKRTEKGQFPKGVSGNPTGRPKGSKNEITLLRQSLDLQLRAQGAERMPEVLDKAFELALEGDRPMIKLLLELNMSKAVASEKEVQEKVEINVVGAPPEVKKISVIDVKPEDIDDAEE